MKRRKKEPMITQDELAEYQSLRALIKQAKNDRLDFIARLESGAEVEPGPLSLTLKDVSAVRATWSALTELLGEARVEWLRARIPPKVTKTLRVFENRNFGHALRRNRKRTGDVLRGPGNTWV